MAQDKSKLTERERKVLAELEKGDYSSIFTENPDNLKGLHGWVIPGFRIPWVEVLIGLVGLLIIYYGMRILMKPHFPEPCQTYTYTTPAGQLYRYCIGEGPNPEFGK